ncbi:MAG: DinB family protein [Phycisphaerae bacterium]|nr:DinB family protein [Phycisphaerae bacterium]
MNLLDHHRSMLAYEREASRRVLGALVSVPADRRGDPPFVRARGILSHVQLARRMWLSRLGAIAKPEWVMFPDWPLDKLDAEMTDLDRLWANYLEPLREAELSNQVRYASTEGVAYVSTIHEILTHVHNHSTYHRGQVAMLLAQVGGQRAVTDFIALTRRTV